MYKNSNTLNKGLRMSFADLSTKKITEIFSIINHKRCDYEVECSTSNKVIRLVIEHTKKDVEVILCASYVKDKNLIQGDNYPTCKELGCDTIVIHLSHNPYKWVEEIQQKVEAKIKNPEIIFDATDQYCYFEAMHSQLGLMHTSLQQRESGVVKSLDHGDRQSPNQPHRHANFWRPAAKKLMALVSLKS